MQDFAAWPGCRYPMGDKAAAWPGNSCRMANDVPDSAEADALRLHRKRDCRCAGGR